MMKFSTHRVQRARGMTFIEALIWIAVFTAVMMAIVTSLLSFYRANTYTIEQAQAVSEARRGIEETVAVMREATHASTGAYPIISIGADELMFYGDTDDDPYIERVRFFVVGTELRRGILEPSGSPLSYSGTETVSVVSQHIRNLDQDVTTFRYYDNTGSEVTSAEEMSAVRFITIDLVVNVSPDRLPNELTIRSSAMLRNVQ